MKLKNEKIAEIKNNELFRHYFINYQKPSDMYKKFRETKGKINEDQVDLIKEIFIRKNKKKKLKIYLKIKKL